MIPTITAKKNTYVGLFLITLATLMHEILLTRIFSVTMWYHFAFVAISVAMFGMTVGAVLVYLFPGYFTQERVKHQLALSSFCFGVSIVISFLTHLSMPFVPERSIVGFYSTALTYTVLSVPFVFSGICVCLALTKFPRQVSKLYAVDLAGAAFGCLLLILTLGVTDGPTAVIVVALLACTGSVFFAVEAGDRKLVRIAIISSLSLAGFAAFHTVLVYQQFPILRLMWVKGRLEHSPLYEKWNSFSRIRVTGDPNRPEKPFGWGLSPLYPSDRDVKQLHIKIDATAGTVLTGFNGDLKEVEHLKYDITNLAHYIRPESKVLVVGAGGGRDVLSALVFGQKSVVGVEINQDITDTINRRFGDFTGHLDQNPKVIFVDDEARSYIARQEDRFDIIQVSLIDTWAATAAGAFVLTENSLYTVEAWRIFLEHLTSDGVLTFSRWYFQDRPGEMYRLTSLASASLMQLGVENPRNHMVIARHIQEKDGNFPDGVGTLLVSKTPFSDKDLDTLSEITGNMNFDLVLSPKFSLDNTFSTIASGIDLDGFTTGFPINITAPTDDRPFFFHMLWPRDVFNRDLWKHGIMSFNMKAVFVLVFLLIIVVGLTFFCIIVPLLLTTDRKMLKGTLPLFIFFGSIGLGFMLVEISQMQRLIIFLGHPTYGLSVVLFALLISSGLGSFLTQKIGDPKLKGSGIACLSLLLCSLIILGIFTPSIARAFQSSETTIRILVSIGILFPIGLFMGMAFPLGMKMASAKTTAITPWFWGINGATSVCASVIAVTISLGSSISTSFWTGFSCYAVALVGFIWESRR